MKQQPRKAPGPDGLPSDICRTAAAAIAPALHNLILKSFLCGYEPLGFKGGNLCSLWKGKGSTFDSASYRGILLADSYAKVFHAWTRKRLLPTLLHRRTEGQLGGMPSQQTTVGIHVIRLHSRLGRLRRLSTGVLFLDLKAAFHHMIRELIFKVQHQWTQSQLMRMLDPTEFNLEQLLADIDDACHHCPDDTPPGLRLLLHDLHCSTWFRLDPEQDEYTRTLRGTRPGSPMADIGFNLLMSRILQMLHDDLLHIPQLQAGHAALGVSIPPIAWVDDLAIPITATTPEQLVPLMRSVLTTCVHGAFMRHGMTLNFSKGKTEGILMFRGPGANRCRSEVFDQPRPPCLVVSVDTHILTLRVGATYKHLGAHYAMDADLTLEIDTKIAIAKRAFEEVKKAIFLNQMIPVEARVTLHASLVLSRVLYGCANWADVPASQLQRLEAMMTRHYRRI